jgi:CheY-like chemotaxis protein
MAHEIRTPLHQVAGFLELLAHTILNSQQKEYVDLMENSAVTLTAVINDLLDFTKLEAEKMKLEVIPFDIRGVVAGSLAAVRPKAEAKGLELSSEYDGDLSGVLLGDPNRLRQILLNCFRNAVKFTHEGSIGLRVRKLACTDRGRVHLRFVVTDTGICISQEHRQHIFKKYVHADPSVARNFGGTGLGLAICKTLVELYGGTIGVDSTVGQGSEFWFELPLERSHRAKTPKISRQPSTKNFTSLNVLVADDNKINQKLACAVLKRMGHSSTVAVNGLQAVKAVQMNKYDIVLMDVQMPEMDGIQATKEIRGQGWSANDFPVIGLTADFRSAERGKYLAVGMNDCLGKPLRMDDLQAVIADAIGHKAKQ